MILDPAKDRFRDGADVKLIVAAQPAVRVQNAPANASRQKQRADFIILRRIDNAEQVAGLDRDLEPRWIERSGGFVRDFCASEHPRCSQKKDENNENATSFHAVALAYG